MKEEIKIHELVATLKDLPEEGIKRGYVGTIVEKWDSGHYEIEFANEKGETLAFAGLKENEFVVLHHLTLAA